MKKTGTPQPRFELGTVFGTDLRLAFACCGAENGSYEPIAVSQMVPPLGSMCLHVYLVDSGTQLMQHRFRTDLEIKRMNLKPPPVDKGQAGLDEFRKKAKLYELSLTNRMSREFYRADLSKWKKLYATLADKREPGSNAAIHFAALSSLCSDLLDQYGPEPPPKKRAPKTTNSARLVYPDFPDEVTHRLHFLEGPGARRQRAIDLASHAAVVFRQTSGTGRVLVSVGTQQGDVRLFERLVEAIGAGLFGDPAKSGFDAERKITQWPSNAATPLERVWQDNNQARGYSWQARALGDQFRGVDGKGLPQDLPEVKDAPPWDPDPKWQQILNLTEANRLPDAMVLVEAIPGRDREALLDEVIYLKFLTDRDIRADDVRLIARKYAATSLISGRLHDEFEAFVAYFDQELQDDPPVLSKLTRFDHDFGQGMIPVPPPSSDWSAYRAYQAQFTNPTAPRGRIFSVNIDVGFANVESLLAGHMALAEDAFRRDRSIPEIGASGWISELALLDLFRAIWPNAKHQWRPWFLGRQSIDIYIPEINLAVEYQGQQHYEPVALFGGEEGFKNAQIRDERKRLLLEANSVRLLEWRYDAPKTREALVLKLSEMGIPLRPEN
ncbi:hypothetical protein [Phaeobacter sp. 11ANDIMAR09]|uniref:hypothetical protein n=1 Tax=Phaeobacter sp. 11ANDIMAR09 TaxID=1225647 RepID=UPI0012EE7548|nr:hypothetical protein [Phaeobacter sp. 11ANDIMAR09]